MSDAPARAVVLMNVGTPDAPTTRDVRRYLREFLSDGAVLDLPAPLRWLLLNLIILPRRPKHSAEAYRAVWTAQGSPLLVYSRMQQDGLAARMEEPVLLAMRYGAPSIAEVVAEVAALGVKTVVLAPLFPQYAGATVGTAVAAFEKALAALPSPPALRVVAPFFGDPSYLDAQAARIRAHTHAFQPDALLLSYHGLPERQVKRADATGRHCLASAGCCDALGPDNARCYRAQCFATTRALAARLPGVPVETSFQSRLGGGAWIQPYTDEVLRALAARGVKRLQVACPAFVTDCLETLEEIGMRAKETFPAAGGEALEVTPCLNDDAAWLEALASLVRRA